ncbi:hypothetical protein H6F75_19975 [Nodosilinea sp. FACHB-131]|uniref:hypothetical protein n=1 Tax=Cyanophyceae TaxID=3028117 RepID=UPI0016871778|nr:hypothetical protein [Nodosilinea sp. FACHB-131]MBD1875765.1 hypothetical protein [Nodosilinea sp. FACHB-131]
MLPKLAALGAFAIAILAIVGSYGQMSALRLGQQSQPLYWPHRSTRLSGLRTNNTWKPSPNRSAYEGFQGGGIGVGK